MLLGGPGRSQRGTSLISPLRDGRKSASPASEREEPSRNPQGEALECGARRGAPAAQPPPGAQICVPPSPGGGQRPEPLRAVAFRRVEDAF